MNIKTLNKIAMTMAVAIAATACSGGDKAKEEKKAADGTMNVEVAKQTTARWTRSIRSQAPWKPT